VGATAVAMAVVVLVVGCILGWHANRAHTAHGDVKITRGRIRGYRKTRLRSGLFAIGLVLVALIVVRALYSS
jgi:hypothetical protein